VRFETEQDTTLFSFSDRPVHQALGILREQRLDD
jgi:gentisate 1,2-dioxygenase